MNEQQPLTLPGLFWELDPPKSNEARTPPEPVWLAPDYLPGLEAARQFERGPFMTWQEIEAAQYRREPLLCDVEIYPNYFLVAFTSFETGKGFYFEKEYAGGYEQDSQMDCKKLAWVLSNFLIVTFNGNGFDLPILALACNGKNIGQMKHACNMIILQDIKPWQVLKSFQVEELDCNHIDLMEVCPQKASLKIYGGRVHVPKMQDLPFPPETDLSPDQIAIVRHYCFNDLTATAFLYANLSEQLGIRSELSAKYGVDLRSKSDAQIAEAVIKSELKRLNGFEAYRPEIPPGTVYVYHVPAYLSFQTPQLQAALNTVRNCRFVIDEKGSVEMPPEIDSLKIELGKAVYKMGIGGLHSTEKTISHKAGNGFKLIDRDVASYYPAIILNQRLHPVHLGGDFITIYKTLVDRRVNAKDNETNRKNGTVDKVLAEMLKIVINGSYGKFGSKWSALYAPDLMIQVTLTGQLSLLMLIEDLERNGVEICSANTDGIVMRYPESMQYVVDSVVSNWERVTGFVTEETEYAALYCRDVNNYIAIKPNGSAKTKGAFFSPWGLKGFEIFRFAKNPTNSVCIDAAIAYLTKSVPISETIRGCRDLTKFLTVRVVKGGGSKDGVYLGKAVRWYYATNSGGEIVYVSNGNKVPLSDGAKPCLDLPEEFPGDVDFLRYESLTVDILREIGAI